MSLKELTVEAKQKRLKELLRDLDLNDIINEVPEFDLIPIKDSMADAIAALENPDMFNGIPTRYPILDKLVGGFAPEELIVVAGGTGQGKTQFVQSLMINMALDNNPILFFTLEMPPRETSIRFMRMIKAKGVGLDTLVELPIYYYHGTNASLPILDKAIQKGVKKGIKLVVIDHLHFFSKTSENQAAEIGNIVREIKLMARKYEIPIILISHIRKTNKAGEVPGLEDLKDSSGTSQDADMVLMVWRDMESRDEQEQRILKVRVRKNRRKGKLGGAEYVLDDNYFLQEKPYAEGYVEI